jgi:hypothetical protein
MRTEHAGIFTLSTMNRSGRVVIALLLSSVLWAPESWAQNLLLNPDFDDAALLTNWTPLGGSGTQIHNSAQDVGNVAASGAVDITLNAATAAGAQSVLESDCVAVSPNTNYNYGTRVKVPTGQNTGDVDMWVEVEFFSGASCVPANSLVADAQGGTIGAVDYPLSDTVWYGIPGTVPGTAQTVMSPATAGRALVRLYLERASGAGVATAFFDRPFLGVGVIPVELQEFVVE